jgi:hypothetical protein
MSRSSTAVFIMVPLARAGLSLVFVILVPMCFGAALVALDWHGLARRLWGPVLRLWGGAPTLRAYRVLSALSAFAAGLGALNAGVLLFGR